MSTSSSLPPAVGNFVQPVLTIVDPQTFGVVRDAIASSFSTARVEGFLKSMTRGNMRIRDFDTVLNRGLLGPSVKAEYDKLSNADQGQIREFYLASLEKVDLELRNRFFKLYAYY